MVQNVSLGRKHYNIEGTTTTVTTTITLLVINRICVLVACSSVCLCWSLTTVPKFGNKK